MRLHHALLAALALSLAACDAAAGGPSAPVNAVTLETRTAPAGDVVYALAPLDLDESFDVTLDVGGGAAALRSTRSAAGYELAFEPSGLAVDRVVVRYLFDGEEVAEPVEFVGAGPAYAGIADEGPDSWHYICEDGHCVYAKDYKKNGLAGQSGSTEFETADGRTVEVTDVAFEVYGPGLAAPSAVRFASPRAVEVEAQSFGRPLR